MFVAKSIPAEHKDLIHDVAYDYHGRRMATCSSDQCVKVVNKRTFSSNLRVFKTPLLSLYHTNHCVALQLCSSLTPENIGSEKSCYLCSAM